MNNIENYNKVFCETFELSLEKVEALEYLGISAWDSVGHMALIAGIEEAFDIMMEIEDLVDFSSYTKGKEILVEKYDVKF